MNEKEKVLTHLDIPYSYELAKRMEAYRCNPELGYAGTLLNQKFTPDVVAGEKGLENMSSLIRSYFAMDGHHIQFNVIDRQTLIEAQKHPDDYRDLIVRVAGYSDFFRNLSKPLQDEIINRTEQSFE